MGLQKPGGHLPTSQSPVCVQGTPNHRRSHPQALKEGDTEAQRHDGLSTLHAEWQRKGSASISLSQSPWCSCLPVFSQGHFLGDQRHADRPRSPSVSPSAQSLGRMCHQRPATGPFDFHRHQLIRAAEDFAVWERTKAETLIFTCGVRLRRASKGLGG